MKKDQTVYYVAISAMQKCIRRCEPAKAVAFAKICWDEEPYRLWARLWTVLFEDCGRNIKALRMFYEYKDGYSDFSTLAPLIVELAEGYHTKDVNCLSRVPKRMNITPLLLHGAVKDKHPKVLSLYEKYQHSKFEVYDAWDFGEYAWVIDVAERSLSYDREQMGISAPYFWMTDTIQTEETPDDEVGPSTLLNGFLPAEALDVHTRPGKMAMSVYQKNCKPNSDRKLFGLYLHFADGWCLRNRATYNFDFVKLRFDMEPYNTPTKNGAYFFQDNVLDYTRNEVLPELNKTRLWVMDKPFKNQMDELKAKFEYNYSTLEMADTV
jgi:hypothetical protein